MARLAQRIERIHTSPIRRVAALLDEARERSDIISFGGGAPSLPPPNLFLKEFNRLMAEEALRSCGYTGTRGIPELRAAVAADVKRYGKVDFDPATEIILTTGATESIFSSLMCLVDAGDEVIITDPTYLGYQEMIELAQGRPKSLPVSVEDRYQPDSERLKEVISTRTKAVILLSPDNPTGRIISDSFVRTLVELAEEHDFWIISDDIYKHIIYEGEHVWVSRYPGAKERTITVCSFSKEAGIPGLRLGYTLAPKQVIESIEKMQQYSTLAPETVGQFALVTFLNQNMKERYIKDSVSAYLRKRDFMGRMIQKHLPLARTIKPAGAYYYFVDLRQYSAKIQETEEGFARQLLDKTSVALIPGRFFGENGKGHVRMTFVTEPEERIQLGFEKIAQFLEDA
jgi:aspartate aminotransferase